MNWSSESLSSSKLNEKEFLHANILHPGRWDHWNHYEVCSSFATLAPQTEVFLKLDESPLEEATTVWDQLVDYCQTRVDMNHPSAMKHGEIFLNVNRVFKGLKKLHPEWILPTVALLLPRCGAQLGACSLCPRGIGNPALAKITDEGVNNLIAGMEHKEDRKSVV